MKCSLNVFFLVLLFSGSATSTFAGDCDEISGRNSADSSPNRDYFKRLLNVGADAPIQAFLKPWFPQKINPSAYTYLFDCQERPWGELRLINGNVPKGCEPDVLYSWGPKAKLDSLKRTYSSPAAWAGLAYPGQPDNSNYGEYGPPHGSIFAALSPSITLSYGLVPIRFKIRKGIPFRDTLKPTRGNVRVSGNDLTFFEASVLDSWSYGTPEHYDEIVRDILRISSGRRATSYKWISSDGPRGSGLERFYDTGVNERGGEQNEENLKRNLLEMIRMILNGEGRIFYRPGTCQSRAIHFQTERPTYFNPQ